MYVRINKTQSYKIIWNTESVCMRSYESGLRNPSRIYQPARWVRISSFGCQSSCSRDFSPEGREGKRRAMRMGPESPVAGSDDFHVPHSTIVSWFLRGTAGTCVLPPWWAACGLSRSVWSQVRCQRAHCSGPGCTCSPWSVTASCAWSPGCSWTQTREMEENKRQTVSRYSTEKPPDCPGLRLKINNIFIAQNIQEVRMGRLELSMDHIFLIDSCFCIPN